MLNWISLTESVGSGSSHQLSVCFAWLWTVIFVQNISSFLYSSMMFQRIEFTVHQVLFISRNRPFSKLVMYNTATFLPWGVRALGPVSNCTVDKFWSWTNFISSSQITWLSQVQSWGGKVAIDEYVKCTLKKSAPRKLWRCIQLHNIRFPVKRVATDMLESYC